jgi:hypothetical protein
MRFLMILLPLCLLSSCTKAPDTLLSKPAYESQQDEQYRKELEEIRKTMKGEIKVKLKKDGKGDFYSWEISGKDAHEVLKVNDILDKKLNK